MKPSLDIKTILDVFHRVQISLYPHLVAGAGYETETGIYQDAVFLKLYKPGWTNFQPDGRPGASRIFFSVWMTENSLCEGRLLYNIHAFKLRTLGGYRIESRKFAALFRDRFRECQAAWPNVETAFGPLTLMQGWVTVEQEAFEKTIVSIACRFPEIAPLVDECLREFRNGDEG